MTIATPHLDDAALLRVLDGARDESAPDAAAHLDTCRQCAARLDTVRQRSAALSAAIGGVRVPPLDDLARARQRAAIEARLAGSSGTATRASGAAGRRWRWTSPWIRAAAAILIVAGVAAAASPVRAWIAEHIAPGHQPRETPASTTAPPTASPSAPPAASEVFFTVNARELTVTVVSMQRAGEVVIRRADGPQSSASVLGGVTEELLVLPDGVRIRNDSNAVSSYLVRTEPAVERIRLRVGGGATARVVAVPDSGDVRIPLSAPR